MKTEVKRRYQDRHKPEFRTYNDRFDQLLLQSDIFNTERIPNAYMKLWDRQTIEAEIYQLEQTTIPNLKQRLEEINNRFAAYCDQQANLGYERPSIWPEGLLIERIKQEATHDFRCRELEFLNDKLTKLYIEPAKMDEAAKVLAYGPRGMGQLHNGVLCMIDGQRVATIDDELVIVSESSPYRGMAVADYRRAVVIPWVAAESNKLTLAVKLRDTEFKTTGTSTVRVPLGIRKVSRNSLPSWPTGVANQLIKEPEHEK